MLEATGEVHHGRASEALRAVERLRARARAAARRTKWTRRVPRPVLIGHAASLTPYSAVGGEQGREGGGVTVGTDSCANTDIPSSPSSPTLFLPHTKRVPSRAIAVEKWSPHEMKDAGGISATALGSRRSVLSPCPSRPWRARSLVSPLA